MASPEQAATFYDNQPTADGDTKSRSTSGLAAAPSEHLSLQPTTEEPSENLVPELATQVTSQSHAITSSAENYIVSICRQMKACVFPNVFHKPTARLSSTVKGVSLR